MNVLSLCGAGLTLAVMGYLLREFGYRGLPVFAAAAGLVLLKTVLPSLSDTVGEFRTLAQETGSGEMLSVALKTVGIACLSQLTADVAGDLGEGGIARAVTAVGRLSILGAALPSVLSLLREGLALVS